MEYELKDNIKSAETLQNVMIALLEGLKECVQIAEHLKVTDEQWYLNIEDNLNSLSVKDHNTHQH